MSEISNVFRNKFLVLGAVVIVIVIILIALISFKTTRTPLIVSSFILISVVIVAALAFLFLWPKTPYEGTQFTLTLTNSDPTLSHVQITLPNEVTLSLVPGQSQAGVTIEAAETIKATGYRIISGNTITYNLDYVFNNLTEIEIFYTSGGVQTNNTFISSLPVQNNDSQPVILYTQDLKGNIYGYEVISVGESTISTYISQFFSTSSDGSNAITIPNTTVVSLTIDSSGDISVSNLPSANITFVNGTSIDGWLQSQNPWEVSSSWVTMNKISAGKNLNMLVYVNQWWRIISQSTDLPITDVFIVSESDLTSVSPIVLDE